MKTKNAIVGSLIFLVTLMSFTFTNQSKAVGSGIGYVKVINKRTSTVEYSITDEETGEVYNNSYTMDYAYQLNSLENDESTKNIWKLVTCTEGGTETSTATDLYCLRAGLGFTQEEGGTQYNPNPVNYDTGYELPENYTTVRDYLATLESPTTIFKDKKSFNAVMWILDNMLLKGDGKEEYEAFLKKYIYNDNQEDFDDALALDPAKRNLLTREDIEVVQQLAIWYFTNAENEYYHKDGIKTADGYIFPAEGEEVEGELTPFLSALYVCITGDPYDTNGQYMSIANRFNVTEQHGTMRQKAAETLFQKLISNANLAATVAEGNANGLYSANKEITLYLAGGNAAAEQPIVEVKPKTPAKADISLRKFISAVNGVELTGNSSRRPEVDTSKLNTVDGTGKLITTAEYNHHKNPVSVNKDDIVTYTIRLYNEGEVDAYIKEIKDYIPNWLVYVEYGEDTGTYWNLDERGFIATSSENCIITGAGGNLNYEDIKGKKLGEVKIPKAEYNEDYEDAKDRYTLSYVDIQISCMVMEKAPYETPLTNIAEVTSMTEDLEGNTPLKDRDSEVKNLKYPETEEELQKYMEEESKKPYVPGQQDDDDFDKVIIKTPVIDMALRKFITAIGEDQVLNEEGKYDREPDPKTNALQTGAATTAEYEHTKKPKQVEIGDVITYTIRLYNEGEVDGKVKEVKDYVAPALKYVQYGNDKNEGLPWWTESKGTNYNTLTTTGDCKVINVGGNTNKDYVGGPLSNVIIPHYDKTNDVLSYVDIQVHCQVDKVSSSVKLTNIAEITQETDKYDNPVLKENEEDDTKPKDKDSFPGNVNVPPDNEKYPDLPTYEDDDIKKNEEGTMPYIPGQQDDDDFEKVEVIIKNPDFSLRKYISAVDGEELTGKDSREPDVKLDNFNKVVNGELQTTAEYEHTKEPKEVKVGSLVTYTIRVYNEGEIDGYIQEITDYLPEYLIYEPENEINKKYGWAYDEETRQVKTVITAKDTNLESDPYADRENGRLLTHYEEGKELDYIDVQIVCKVSDEAIGNGILTNLAQITKMADETGRTLEEDRDSKPDGDKRPDKDFWIPEGEDRPTYKDDESDKPYVPGQEDDDDFEKVKVIVPELDFSLRKYISAVDGEELTGKDSREPDVKLDNFNKVVNGELQTTAEYEHTKNPKGVKVGSLVTYTIRVYNEGDIDGYIQEITDYLPEYLIYEPENEINKKYDWEYDEETRQVKTKITARQNDYDDIADNLYADRENGRLLTHYEEGNDLDYIDVQIVCKVSDEAIGNGILTNLAQITKMADETGKTLEEDRDSKPDGDKRPDKDFWIPEGEDRPTYKDDESDKPYVPGQEDDDDFEKVLVIAPAPDFALRKYISAVNGEDITGDKSREPDVKLDNFDKVVNGELQTTAEYEHSKKPVEVNRGDLVTYTIRVYNEGAVDGYVSEITDYLPDYLTFVSKEENEINKKYGWEYDEETRQVKTVITAKDTNSESDPYADRENGRLLTHYEEGKNLDYIDVQIVCKVSDEAIGNGILTNLAQITKMTDKNGNPIEEDRDSTPDGDFELPEDRPHYKDDESDKPYVPGQEDDDDFEKVVVKARFDLALRKFITKVQDTDINNRYPEVTYEDGKLKYNHTKEPVKVVTGDTVIYTIRVYNEGEKDGYANEITDDMPEGLEFLVDNEVNKEYRWKMLDANQEETNDLSAAKYIVTDYLSEEQEEETGRDNMLKAFNKNADIAEGNPDYRDLKVAFKVTYEAKTKVESERIIVNVAQISEDSDDDIDSEPDRDTPYDPEGPNEDDIDYDNVYVKYFDLALLKWVSQTDVTIGNKHEIKDTGHTAETSKNEAPVKMEIDSKDLDEIVIKYVYTIQITNEGEIEGYATEIRDYIPDGLEFIETDNTEWHWQKDDDGTVTTDYLKDTLLQPGESATVPIVLRWINNKDNLGEKVNTAEISKDYNESGSPDVDSTPDNKVPGEDDIDDAPVILAIKTGAVVTYFGLVTVILVMIGSGLGLIKRYVLE